MHGIIIIHTKVSNTVMHNYAACDNSCLKALQYCLMVNMIMTHTEFEHRYRALVKVDKVKLSDAPLTMSFYLEKAFTHGSIIIGSSNTTPE